MLNSFCNWSSCQTQSRSTQITIYIIWFVSRKVWSLASAYTCLQHGMKLSFLCKSRNGKEQHSVYFSCYSLPQPILLGAYTVTNPWGLFLRDSAIKLQKQSNPSSTSWAKNWQQMSTNPEDHAHICPQGGLSPSPASGMTIDKCIIIKLQSHFAKGAPSV